MRMLSNLTRLYWIKFGFDCQTNVSLVSDLQCSVKYVTEQVHMDVNDVEFKILKWGTNTFNMFVRPQGCTQCILVSHSDSNVRLQDMFICKKTLQAPFNCLKAHT